MGFSAIHDWLRTRGTYARGITLLKLHGQPSGAQLILFSLPESPFSRMKLEEALRAVNQANPAPQPLESRTNHTPVEQSDDVDTRVHKRMLHRGAQDIPPELLPSELRPLRHELKQLFREYTYTRGTMRNIPDGMHLRQVAEQVVELRRKMRAGWWRIEHWRKTGTVVMLGEHDQVTNPVDLQRRERALSTWLSQHKPGAKNQRKCTPEQFQAKEKELADIRKLIKDGALHT